MTSLETLYHTMTDDNEAQTQYDVLRLAKVAEITEYISPHLANPLNAPDLAEAVMSSAEEFGRFDCDYINGEIAASYTTSGNPLPFMI